MLDTSGVKILVFDEADQMLKVLYVAFSQCCQCYLIQGAPQQLYAATKCTCMPTLDLDYMYDNRS